MLILHHLNNSRSQRILWLLEELGIDYRIETYQRDAQTQLAPPELKGVHPLGKAPVITDGDVTLAESGAIIQYLAETYAPYLIPPVTSAPYWQYVYWLHFSEGSLMPPMLLNLVMHKIKTSPMPFIAKPVARAISEKVTKSFVAPNLRGVLDHIDAHLANNQWFAGDELSGADFQMSFPLEAAQASGLTNHRHSNIARFLRQIAQRDAYKRALEKGGSYDYAPDYAKSA